jgi:hypothetical protein
VSGDFHRKEQRSGFRIRDIPLQGGLVSDNCSIKIVRGGNRLELSAQLDYIGRMPLIECPTFALTLQHPRVPKEQGQIDVGVHINGNIDKDGTGENWIILGRINRSAIDKAWLIIMLTDRGIYDGTFNGVYHTGLCTGWIKPGPLPFMPRR